MTTFLIVTGIVILVIIVLNSIKIKPKKQKSVMDELNEDPIFKEMQQIFSAMQTLCEGGTENDTIPEGYGEFGWEATNPIPVNTISGSKAYLGRLRTNEGVKISYDRLGSTFAKNIDRPIDMYEISANGNKIGILYISPYHKKNSDRAPKGLKLAILT